MVKVLDLALILLACPTPTPIDFDLPELDLSDVFPFSVILWTFQILGSLAGGGGSAPCFNLGLMGSVCTPDGPAVGMIRSALGVVGVGGMCLFFYKLISGKGADNN